MAALERYNAPLSHTRAMRPQQNPQSEAHTTAATQLLSLAQQAWDYQQTQGVWPKTDHPEFGGLMKRAQAQFNRIRKGEPPLFNATGYTPEVHAFLLGKGFTAPSQTRQQPGKTNFVDTVVNILREGGKLDRTQIRKLRDSYRQGSLTEGAVNRLRAAGFRF